MPSKRDHIITSALHLYRTTGVCGTTLKDVSHASGVPLGNLYYYFKTRDELVLAALEACEGELRVLLDRLAPLPPREWIEAYFEWLLLDSGAAARDGCPFDTLALELRSVNDPVAPRAAQVVRVYLDAMRSSVSGVGVPVGLAEEMFLAVQGAYVVSRVLGDPDVFQENVTKIRDRTLSSLAG